MIDQSDNATTAEYANDPLKYWGAQMLYLANYDKASGLSFSWLGHYHD